MAKSSGTTRGSSSSAPRGLSEYDNVVSDMGRLLESARKEVDRKGFTKVMNGQWELETPYGGAQILDETSPAGETFGYKEYGVSAWDANYDMIEDGQERNGRRFESLNEAKAYAKELIKNSIK